MAKQTKQEKQLQDLNLEFEKIRNTLGQAETLIGDMVYIYSGGQSRDFYKLTELKKVVVEKFQKAQAKTS